MKKILIPTLFVLLAACSGEKAGVGRIKYEKTGSNKAWQAGEAALRACKDEDAKKEPCATLQLKEGASIPKHPLTSIDDIAVLYVYDPTINPDDPVASYKMRYNCAFFPDKKDEPTLCLNIDEANRLLAPFVK
ncbi:MAG: hypothetical protein ACFN4D_04940 [Cardiobacterium sp.]